MTARERMVAGELYDALDPELVEARERARQLLARYNASGDREALTALFGRLADDAVVEAPFHCDYGFNISVGRRFYANVNCVFLDCAPIEIGDHVLLGPAVHLYTATHPLDSAEPSSRGTFLQTRESPATRHGRSAADVDQRGTSSSVAAFAPGVNKGST